MVNDVCSGGGHGGCTCSGGGYCACINRLKNLTLTIIMFTVWPYTDVEC